ncbi:MAG TPA: glycerophosphodiester phosphodiesterase family protein [Kineosporiaceae bacterium]
MHPLPCLDRPVPFAMAHRGFDPNGLENSMPAFEAAVGLGVDFLETDVQVTSDGVLLAFHDARLDRVTDMPGRVGHLPWSRVRRALIGGVEPIPRLEEVLDAWPHVRVNVDLKVRGAVAPFVQAVRRTRSRDRVCVTSFSDRRRAAAVRELRRDGPIAWSPGIRSMIQVVAAVRGAGPAAVSRVLGDAACVQVPVQFGGRQVIGARFVRSMQEAGLQVHVWTVDDPEQMRHLLAIGVDAIVTNRSDLAVRILREPPRAPGDVAGGATGGSGG